MESSQTTPYQYLVSNPEFPYCAGCGHTWINKAVAQALEKLQVKPTKVNLVSDIGCVGLVDKLFLTNTIHTTHGRSTAFATGLQLADQILYDGDAIHIVMIGDGGATIGLLHLVEAAKLNANVTVILHNNFVYGMTGGQNSGLTPESFRTATTMSGSLTPNIHIAHMLEAAHAGFIARKLATDKDLVSTIVEAIQYPGFSVVEIIELCTGYATKWNSMTKNDVQEILEKMDAGQLGTIVKRTDRQSYADLYKQSFPKKETPYKPKAIEAQKQIQTSLSVILSGSAGEGVQFAAKNLIETALKHGLNVMQKNDNPVTIGTGFSFSEVKLSSEEILYSGITEADYLLISSMDGLKRAKSLIKTAKVILIDESLAAELTATNIHSFPFRKLAKDPQNTNLLMLGYLFKLVPELDLGLFLETIQANGKNTEKIVEAVNLGFSL